MGHVSISRGNTKMGNIPSVSLPAGLTCRSDCECLRKCYARKLERLRTTVRNAYHNNYDVLKFEPQTFWREVEATVMLSRYFRFHVSGDIPDEEYFNHMVEIAQRNLHCEILCFTKKYAIVNSYLETNELPQNLHMIFSAWRGLDMDNPYHLPEAHVRYRDGTTTASEGAFECNGNCTECATIDAGCWTLSYGEQVVFNEH